MRPPVPDASAHRRFGAAQVVLGGLAVVFVALLSLPFPSWVGDSASGVGLVVAGLAATVSAGLRGRIDAPDRWSWRVLAGSGTVALAGNLWVAITGADPVADPSTVSIASIAVALVGAIVALAIFPGDVRRGRELAVMVLDGLIAGSAFLLIASVTVYAPLLESTDNARTTGANSASALAFPVLDVLLATLAVLLVVRARPQDRLTLVLVAGSFGLYATSDLAYAVKTAQATFHFGTVLDLGWILGYLVLALAAWTPPSRAEHDRSRLSSRAVDGLGSGLVFTVFGAATVVEVLFGGDDRLQGLRAALWVALVLVTGARQLLLTLDNASLRHGLEQRVVAQTEDLSRLAHQNEVLITSVADGVYGVDGSGRITFVNPSAAQALDYTVAELLGRSAHDLFHAPDRDGAPFPSRGCYVHEAITDRVVAISEEDEYVRRDGSTFPVEITASPLRDSSAGAVGEQGAVITFRDVTQRREVDRLKDEFISVVSHELRTPLTSIRGSLGLLASGRLGELPDRAGPLVDVAVQSTERLTRLINDLLDIERIQSGTKTLDTSDIEARDLLEQARAQIEGFSASIGVRVLVAEDAAGWVVADADQVLQTLLNLVGNAVKFSEPGSAVLLTASEQGEAVVLEVADHGRGIPADKLESVFERFQQVDSSDTRRKGGTGLGLAISRGIVERHGGRIWAESELGVGTTVRFTLPAAHRPPVRVEEPPTDPSAPLVLVCEDDAAALEQLVALLCDEGYRVAAVAEGNEAVRVAMSERPQVVLLDLMLPDTTGARVLTALRAAEATRDVPVIVVSGLGPETDRDVAADAEEWLVKPVSGPRLVQAVSLAIAQRSASTVLLVEDDRALSEVLTTLLAADGIEVVHATTAADAIARGSESPPDVIVLDLMLPDGSGDQVVRAFSDQLRTARIPLVVYTSTEVEDTHSEDLSLGPTMIFTKGRTSPEQLREHVLGVVATLADVSPLP